VRSRKKRRTDVYRTDFNRLSIYPRYQVPKPGQELKRFSPGDIIKIRITGLDDDGRPTALIKGYTVVVKASGLEPGQEIKVVVENIDGKTIYAKQLEE
jgi:predicted RNA-binding protein with TRAM domain